MITFIIGFVLGIAYKKLIDFLFIYLTITYKYEFIY